MDQKAQNVWTYLREWVRLNPKTLVVIGAVLLGVVMLGYCSSANAQTAPAWNEARVSWSAPTAFTDGSPIGTASITYSLQRRLGTGTWAAVGGSLSVLTYLDTNLSPGVWCYRVSATVGDRTSAWSNEGCKTVTQPDPNPPVIQVVDGTVYDVRFNPGRVAFQLGRHVGSIPVGAACLEDFVIDGSMYRVERSEVAFYREPRSAVVVARCGLA